MGTHEKSTIRKVSLNTGIWGNNRSTLWGNWSPRISSEVWDRTEFYLRVIPWASVASEPPSNITTDVSVWGNYVCWYWRSNGMNTKSLYVCYVFLFILLCTNGKIIDHWNCLHRKHTQWQATTSSLFCAKETCGWWMLGLISAETVWGCQCVISLAGLGHKLEFCAKPGGKQSLGQFSSFWHRPTTTGWLQVGIFSGQVWFYEYREQ